MRRTRRQRIGEGESLHTHQQESGGNSVRTRIARRRIDIPLLRTRGPDDQSNGPRRAWSPGASHARTDDHLVKACRRDLVPTGERPRCVTPTSLMTPWPKVLGRYRQTTVCHNRDTGSRVNPDQRALISIQTIHPAIVVIPVMARDPPHAKPEVTWSDPGLGISPIRHHIVQNRSVRGGGARRTMALRQRKHALRMPQSDPQPHWTECVSGRERV